MAATSPVTAITHRSAISNVQLGQPFHVADYCETLSRRGSFQFGLGKWQVYPFG